MKLLMSFILVFMMSESILANHIIQRSYSFESNLDRWNIMSHVPADPNLAGETVAWSIKRSSTRATLGHYSLRFFIDGRQDDGVIWTTRYFAVKPDTTYKVNISLKLWNSFGDANAVSNLAFFAGPQAPQKESDFDQSQSANLFRGWKKYSYSVFTKSGPSQEGEGPGELWVGVGISAIWETFITHYIDDLQIQIVPAP